MPQIAVRLSDEEIRLLDRLVAEQHFASRADVIRGALARVAREQEDREIAEEYRQAYARVPVTQEEIDWAVAGAKLFAERTKDDPPWDFDLEDDEAAEPTLEQLEVHAAEVLRIVREVVARRSGAR